MYLSFITGNILQKISNNKKNIVLYPQNNFFDHSLFELDNNYYIFNNNQSYYKIPNIIDLPSDKITLYNYNLSITSNIVGYSTSNVKNFHLNSIIFTHSYRPHFIKKEDASILDNNLAREIKVFFTENAKLSWNLNKRSHIVKYGIPKAFKITNKNREKDILILNFDKAVHNQQILTVLKSNGYSCETMDSCIMPTDDINEKLNEYKICIDLAEHNVINMLCAIASGCKVITLRTTMLDNDYGNISGLYLVDSPQDIISSIAAIINNQDNIEQNSLTVSNIYNFDIFSKQITGLIDQVNQEAFIK